MNDTKQSFNEIDKNFIELNKKLTDIEHRMGVWFGKCESLLDQIKYLSDQIDVLIYQNKEGKEK